PPSPPSFPTRRSSDLDGESLRAPPRLQRLCRVSRRGTAPVPRPPRPGREAAPPQGAPGRSARDHARGLSGGGSQPRPQRAASPRSEEHTSELQSLTNL